MNEQLEKSFIEDFEKAIDFLKEDNNLSLFEDKVKAYISSNAELDVAKYLNFQLESNLILGENIRVILNFINNKINVSYSGRYKEVYRRISNLRQFSQIHFMLMENSLSKPAGLKGTLVTHSDSFPTEVLLTITNNNNDYFQTYLDFNNMLTLTNVMLENMVQRFNSGRNQINSDMYNKEFKKKLDDFLTTMDDFFINQNDKE